MVTALLPDDILLIERIKKQNQRALTDLYDAYGRLVYNMAMQVLRSEAAAEEVTQDIFFQVWQKPDSWNPEKGRLVTWLLAATRYRAIDRLRREQRRPLRESISLDDLGHLLNSRATVGESRHDTSRALRALMQSLPDEQQQVVNLAFFRGMTHSEIAEQLQLPLDAAKERVRLALETLHAAWLGEVGHLG